MRVLANTQKTGTGGAALIEGGLRRVDIGFAERILEIGKDLYPGGKYGHQEGEEIDSPRIGVTLTTASGDYRVYAMEEIARALLETGSILIDLERPFKLVSGRRSPVYVDCRRLISFPISREAVTAGFVELIEEEIGLGTIDVIAGGETAGIPFAAFLAQRLKKPMIYVRKEPKGYGRDAPIEGVLEPDQHVLLVEDLVTDGGSKLRFKEGIERAGGVVKDCLTIFEYFSKRAGLRRARETLAEHGLTLHSLTDWDEVLHVAAAEDRFTAEELKQVLEFLQDFLAPGLFFRV